MTATESLEVPTHQNYPRHRYRGPEGVDGPRQGVRWKSLVAGAVGGFIATGPMSVAMALLYRRLPWWQPWALPPREVTANMLKTVGVHEHMSREAETVATVVGHFAYGTLAGTVYGALPSAVRRHALTSGAVYGLVVWAASYGVALPAFRLATPLRYRTPERIGLMIAAHVIWGAVLGSTSQTVARVALGPAATHGRSDHDAGAADEPSGRPPRPVHRIA